VRRRCGSHYSRCAWRAKLRLGGDIVSALASLSDRAKAAELGADAYVPKPFNVEDLLEVLLAGTLA
jgi:DNA-binding response OmpR family regulator